MSIDEAIENLKYDVEIDMYIRDIAPQIAEWLEELKELRELNQKNPFLVDMIKHDSIVRNKAIDDFVKAIVDRGLSANDDKYCITHYDNYLKVIKEIAEQLKAGEQNE